MTKNIFYFLGIKNRFQEEKNLSQFFLFFVVKMSLWVTTVLEKHAVP